MLPPSTCKVRVFLLNQSDPTKDTLGKAVRRINDQHVHAGFDERINAIVRVIAGPYGGAYAQCTAVVLAGAREILGLLKILRRDHPLEFEVVVNNQYFLDAMLMQKRHDLFFVSTLAYRYETLLRRSSRSTPARRVVSRSGDRGPSQYRQSVFH